MESWEEDPWLREGHVATWAKCPKSGHLAPLLSFCSSSLRRWPLLLLSSIYWKTYFLSQNNLDLESLHRFQASIEPICTSLSSFHWPFAFFITKLWVWFSLPFIWVSMDRFIVNSSEMMWKYFRTRKCMIVCQLWAWKSGEELVESLHDPCGSIEAVWPRLQA